MQKTKSIRSLKFSILNGIVFTLLVGWSNPTLAQPWLSNRFAQNCAACHSPGRFNKELSERRCTLACQGCHVNPNGGGMRSQYGKWTQERWLRTYFVDGLLTNKKKPAPFEKQSYFNKEWAALVKKGETLPEIQPPEKKPLLETVFDEEINPKRYSRKHEVFDYTEVSPQIYDKQIPQVDPYNLERVFYLSGGADFRYFILDRVNNTPTMGKKFRAFPMAADLQLRFKPIREHLSLVTEARFLNGPGNSQLEKFFTSESQVRSAYVISDNLPYNSYVMAGLYRPLFGYYTPDHTTLAQTISGLGARSVFLAASVGTSPNVPFLNLHLIQPMAGRADTRGFAANFGGRFVTLGASFMFSYWRTQTKVGAVDLTRSMYSSTGGIQLGPVTANAEVLHVNQEYAPGSANGGDVFTIDTQTQLWREVYFLLGGGYSNIARNLGEGKGLEWQVGVKSYLIAGADLELLFINKKDTVASFETTTQDIQFQIHLFY